MFQLARGFWKSRRVANDGEGRSVELVSIDGKVLRGIDVIIVDVVEAGDKC